MPQSAIDNIPVDVVASAEEIGVTLGPLLQRPAPVIESSADDPHDYTERALEEGALEMNGRPSRFTCPDCGGSLWDADPDEPGKFRCRVGHSWTMLGLLERQAVTLEQALWTALRALSERADLARRMRDDAAIRRHEYGRRLFERQLEEYQTQAEVLRRVLRSPEPLALASEDDIVALIEPSTREVSEAPDAEAASP